MNAGGGRKTKKKGEAAEAKKVASWAWQEKKELADKEEDVLKRDIEDLRAWVDMIEAMNDEQLQEYLENRPADLKTTKGQKRKNKAQRAGKTKSSSSNGIMASVWKFHKE